MSSYKILWTDMHSNLHHEQMDVLPQWLKHARNLLDFWPIAYYPYYISTLPSGLGVEDCYSLELIQADWEIIRKVAYQANEEGFPMFLGYEWQGAGLDGDHNVFFLRNDQNPVFPLRYSDLVQAYQPYQAIGIPHHLAYQAGNRGKNWMTHDEIFSPVAEIYSSHGSSENDETSIMMDRHIHMGPRTGQTSVEVGLSENKILGIMASGDNHSCPAVYGFGLCAVLATDSSKEAIWDALLNRRVYGVTKDRMVLDYTIDDYVMGSVINGQPASQLAVAITGSNALDRWELLADNQVIAMYPCLNTGNDCPLSGRVRFKFQLELGWGPDRKYFPQIEHRVWQGGLSVAGNLLSIEKCWSHLGQQLTVLNDHQCQFELTTYKTTASGKWMGPSAVTTEGFIFEVETDIDSALTLTLDDHHYQLPVRSILKNSQLLAMEAEARQLLQEQYGLTDYYRSDPWWHNAYKIKINKGACYNAYHQEFHQVLDTTGFRQIRIRAWQKNGACAWSSPIFIKQGVNK
ncbi:MAG: hypothetical protein VB012_00585 [Erysipelotrichaceae bacterium]|nr:hypothetical protein [Erysipelotrichaceae bacterium]